MIETHWNPNIANSFIHEGTAGYNMLSYLPEIGETPYLFNELSKEKTTEKLIKDLIDKKLLTDSLTADILYMQLCNKMTASREMFYSVLKILAREETIEAYKDNYFTQTSSIKDGTLICKNKQRKLFVFP